jgi:hypothetical protein
MPKSAVASADHSHSKPRMKSPELTALIILTGWLQLTSSFAWIKIWRRFDSITRPLPKVGTIF